MSALLALCKWMIGGFPSHTLRWRHNGRDSVSNHQPCDCLRNRLFRRRSKKTSKLRVTGLCVGNSPGTGEFPAQMASNAENVSIWWRHHEQWNSDAENVSVSWGLHATLHDIERQDLECSFCLNLTLSPDLTFQKSTILI